MALTLKQMIEGILQKKMIAEIRNPGDVIDILNYGNIQKTGS